MYLLPWTFLALVAKELGVLFSSSGVQDVKGTIDTLVKGRTWVIGSVFVEIFLKPETQFGGLNPTFLKVKAAEMSGIV